MDNLLYKIMIGLFLLMLLVGYALNVDSQNIEVGFRYNPEFSTLFNKNDRDDIIPLQPTSHFTYLNMGIGAVYNLNKNIGFAIDVLWSREGQAFEGHVTGNTIMVGTYEAVVSKQIFLNNTIIEGNYVALCELNYIKLPIMFSVTSDNTKPLFFTALVGPQINFLHSVAQEVNNHDLGYPNSNITPFDLYKPITISGVVAVGAAYNLTTHLVLSAHLRGDYSLKDIEKKDVMVSYFGDAPVRFYSYGRGATYNATAGLMIGLDFKL